MWTSRVDSGLTYGVQMEQVVDFAKYSRAVPCWSPLPAEVYQVQLPSGIVGSALSICSGRLPVWNLYYALATEVDRSTVRALPEPAGTLILKLPSMRLSIPWQSGVWTLAA